MSDEDRGNPSGNMFAPRRHWAREEDTEEEVERTRVQRLAITPLRTLFNNLSRHWRPWPEQILPDEYSYMPSPKLTFIVDEPRNLVCTICRTTLLKFRFESDLGVRDDNGRFRDFVPSILPCGHVAGSVCLATWTEAHSNCPFCRERLVYPGCGHTVKPRPITQESIHILPVTLPRGGEIPDLCGRCLEADVRRDVDKLLANCKRAIIKCRADLADALAAGGDCEQEQMALGWREQELEVLVLQGFYFKLSRRRLKNW